MVWGQKEMSSCMSVLLSARCSWRLISGETSQVAFHLHEHAARVQAVHPFEKEAYNRWVLSCLGTMFRLGLKVNRVKHPFLGRGWLGPRRWNRHRPAVRVVTSWV